MSEKEQFLNHLKHNRYDGEVRRIFGDWLEDHGYDDEAQEQREWTVEKEQRKEEVEKATEFMQEFAEVLSQKNEIEDWWERLHFKGVPLEEEFTAEMLIEAADNYCAGNPSDIFLSYDVPDPVYYLYKEFWKQYAILKQTELEELNTPQFLSEFIPCSC